jgi:hypothetical protein
MYTFATQKKGSFMKWLLALMFTVPAFGATYVSCQSEKGLYQIEAILNEGKVELLTYVKDGAIYKEFTGLKYREKFSNIVFSKVDRIYYSVDFGKEKARYLNITRKVSKGVKANSGKGVFMPRNNIFTADYEIACTFEDR